MGGEAKVWQTEALQCIECELKHDPQAFDYKPSPWTRNVVVPEH